MVKIKMQDLDSETVTLEECFDDYIREPIILKDSTSQLIDSLIADIEEFEE